MWKVQVFAFSTASSMATLPLNMQTARTELGAYIFFFDLDTDAGEEMLAEAIAAVRAKCSWLKNLGRFPVLTAKC